MNAREKNCKWQDEELYNILFGILPSISNENKVIKIKPENN